MRGNRLMKFCFIDAGVFLDKLQLLDPLKEYGEVAVYEGLPADVGEVVRRAGDADVVAFALMQFTDEMIDALPRLRILQFIGTGVWNFVDVSYAESKGIKVLYIENYGSNAVAEFAVSLGMALIKNITCADRILKNHDWYIKGLRCSEIRGATVGVLGTGAIGHLVAEKFCGLGARVIASDIFENETLKERYGIVYKDIDAVLAEADLVTIHMKATPENYRLIDARRLGLMKKGARLVNVSRAELFDNKALFTALKKGDIAGAAIDVYSSEPPGEQDYELALLPNVIATPHIGFYTEEASDNSIVMSVDSIIKALAD